MTSEVELAYDYCQSIAKEHAKNFYYAFRTLPSKRRRAIYATYAFCRVCDDIADEDQPLEDKITGFERTRELLAEAHMASGRARSTSPERQMVATAQKRGSGQSPTTTAEDAVFLALEDAARAYDIPSEYFEQIIQGVEMDLEVTRFQTFEELKDYCYKVASVVGLVCIEVFGYEDPVAKEYAVDMGIAMQLTNILRDVKEDAERGRIYIPLDDMEQFGYTEEDLMGGVANDAFRSLMQFQADRARRYFESSRRLFPLLSYEARACPSVLHGVYSALLDEIQASGYDVFERRISLSKRHKLFLTARLWASSLIPSVPRLRR